MSELTAAHATPMLSSVIGTLARHRYAYLFVSPFFVAFIAFYLVPYAFGFVLPWVKWDGVNPMELTGLGNLAAVFRDARFLGSIGNTVVMWLLFGPTTILLSAVTATTLNSRFTKIRSVWLVLLIMPSVTSMVAAAYTFRLLFDSHSGYVNSVLGVVGVGPVPWLTDVFWARVAVALLVIWGSLGFQTVLMLAGLQTISPEIVEAAKVDGCSSAQAFRKITLPLLRPVILFLFITSLVGTMELFTEPYVLTAGGPIAGTETPAMRIVLAIFNQSEYGYAASMALLLFVFIAPFALFQFWLNSRRDG